MTSPEFKRFAREIKRYSEEVPDEARDLYGKEKYKEAAKLFTAAVEKNPDNWVALAFLGSCERNLKQYGRAIKHLKASVARQNLLYFAWFELATAQALNRHYKAAQKSFIEAMQLTSDNVAAAISAALMFHMRGKSELALACFDMLEKDFNGDDLALVQYARGLVEEKRGEVSEALFSFMQSRETAADPELKVSASASIFKLVTERED